MNQPTLNPDALRRAADELDADMSHCRCGMNGVMQCDYCMGEAESIVTAYLAAALPEVTSVDYHATPEGHYDAWVDTGDGYTQRKGWTLTCIWCRAEFTGATKREALQGYRRHEESILQKLREADAAERAKNRPEVKP